MSHVHESPPVMLAPLFVLAVGAVLAGFVFYEPFVAGDAPTHQVVKHEIAFEGEVEAPVLEEPKLSERQLRAA